MLPHATPGPIRVSFAGSADPRQPHHYLLVVQVAVDAGTTAVEAAFWPEPAYLTTPEGPRVLWVAVPAHVLRTKFEDADPELQRVLSASEIAQATVAHPQRIETWRGMEARTARAFGDDPRGQRWTELIGGVLESSGLPPRGRSQ